MTGGDTWTATSGSDVNAFVAGVDDERKRRDSVALIELLSGVTGEEPRMWGTIVGFGQYHYRYDSGREGDFFLSGFAPRKAAFSIYLNGSYSPEMVQQRDALLARLGKHSIGKGCLYVKRLADVDLAVLEALVRQSVDALRRRYPK